MVVHIFTRAPLPSSSSNNPESSSLNQASTSHSAEEEVETSERSSGIVVPVQTTSSHSVVECNNNDLDNHSLDTVVIHLSYFFLLFSSYHLILRM